MKLQNQVGYIDGQDGCTMVACSALWEMNGALEKRNIASSTPRVLSTEEVILGGGAYLATCSLLFRSALIESVPAWRKIANVGDYPLQIQGSLDGNLFYIPEIMCVCIGVGMREVGHTIHLRIVQK